MVNVQQQFTPRMTEIIENYDITLIKTRELMVGRMKKYGNSIDVMRFNSIIDLVLMKLTRIQKLGADAKIEDEIIDSINYLIFAHEKMVLSDGKGS